MARTKPPNKDKLEYAPNMKRDAGLLTAKRKKTKKKLMNATTFCGGATEWDLRTYANAIYPILYRPVLSFLRVLGEWDAKFRTARGRKIDRFFFRTLR